MEEIPTLPTPDKYQYYIDLMFAAGLLLGDTVAQEDSAQADED